MRDVRLVIFDWDGTLMDSVGRIVSSMQATARALALPVPTEQQVRDIIGLSLMPAFDALFPGLDEAGRDAVLAVYRDQYVELDPTPTPLFPGVEAMLATLKTSGRQLAVATGKARAGLTRVFAETGLEPFFITSRSADEAHSKPHPDMLEQILSETGVAAHQALMIGDSELDMKMARAAGVRALGVGFGVHDETRLKAAGAEAVLGDWPSLAEVLA
ncbi:HAD-IA family hydrolase [Gallaecimonas kandeliae]|uniref:HAD family hydrolase n=1 Tax=Gallaecimonas kandeliae TaxID=3029055 RepID=UPI00264843D2|nr:HAD-IA family hydrolase [Gallaecimonas kandeliae]WKE67397.1 HAD-IA family hydrolase [Gallaecimonas kandeliae]